MPDAERVLDRIPVVEEARARRPARRRHDQRQREQQRRQLPRRPGGRAAGGELLRPDWHGRRVRPTGNSEPGAAFNVAIIGTERAGRTRAAWQAVMEKMVKEKGASLNQKEFAAVLDYLDSFNQSRREPGWNDQPAASHRAAFTAAQVGKLPEPWVAVASGNG